jgi:hypothetical protein
MCGRCSTEKVIKKERYCTGCKKIVLAEMKESGYLQKWIPPSSWFERSKEKWEDRRETVFGETGSCDDSDNNR